MEICRWIVCTLADQSTPARTCGSDDLEDSESELDTNIILSLENETMLVDYFSPFSISVTRMALNNTHLHRN